MKNHLVYYVMCACLWFCLCTYAMDGGGAYDGAPPEITGEYEDGGEGKTGYAELIQTGMMPFRSSLSPEQYAIMAVNVEDVWQQSIQGCLPPDVAEDQSELHGQLEMVKQQVQEELDEIPFVQVVESAVRNHIEQRLTDEGLMHPKRLEFDFSDGAIDVGQLQEILSMIAIYMANQDRIVGNAIQSAQRPHAQDTHEEPIFSPPQLNKQLAQCIMCMLNKRVKDHIDALLAIEERARAGLAVPDDINMPLLFYGDPGTGKSLLAQVIAQVLGRNCVILTPASGGTKYQFSLQEYVKGILKPIIRADRPCVIIVEEIDQLDVKNHSADRDTENPALALCQFIDECEQRDRQRGYPHFLFIGTTNNKDAIPDALLTRMSPIKIDMPDEKLRSLIISHHIDKSEGAYYNAFDISESSFIQSFVKKTQGCSLRDINQIIKLAKSRAWTENKHARRRQLVNKIQLTQDHFNKAYDEHWPNSIAYQNSWTFWFKKKARETAKQAGQKLLDECTRSGLYYLFSYPERREAKSRYEQQESRANQQHTERIEQSNQQHVENLALKREQLTTLERHFQEQNSWSGVAKRSVVAGVGGVSRGVSQALTMFALAWLKTILPV